MSASLRDALLTALLAPTGARLEQVFHAPFVTVLLAERDGGEAGRAALELARDELSRRGVACGRQMVLLASTRPPGASHRDEAKALRARLGIPVVLHDPERSPSMLSSGEDPLAIELDDELREAEAVMVVSAIRNSGRFGEGGGEELLLPGAASAATLRRCEALAVHAEGRTALARAAARSCTIDYALLWTDDFAHAWAGEAPRVFETARAALVSAGARASR